MKRSTNEMSIDKHRILSHINNLVKINTWSSNHEGIQKGLAYIEKHMLRDNKNLRTHRYKVYGGPDLLEISVRGGTRKGKNILLSAHIDTVYPKNIQKIGTLDGKLYGPGTVDMKAGLVVALYALQANVKFNGGIRLLVSPDEEIGSIYHQEVRKKIYSETDIALVFEAAGNNGEFVIQRKGIIQGSIRAYGEAGHAAYCSFNYRKNAIYNIARLIEYAAELNSKKNQLSCNVGMVSGGTGLNVVPDFSEASFDMRAYTTKLLQTNFSRLEKYCKKMGGEVEQSLNIPPMHNDPKLLHEILYELRSTVNSLGQKFSVERRGGGSDGNQISLFTPLVIDGFGPKGMHSHSNNEYVEIESIWERLRVSSLFINKLLTHEES